MTASQRAPRWARPGAQPRACSRRRATAARARSWWSSVEGDLDRARADPGRVPSRTLLGVVGWADGSGQPRRCLSSSRCRRDAPCSSEPPSGPRAEVARLPGWVYAMLWSSAAGARWQPRRCRRRRWLSLAGPDGASGGDRQRGSHSGLSARRASGPEVDQFRGAPGGRARAGRRQTPQAELAALTRRPTGRAAVPCEGRAVHEQKSRPAKSSACSARGIASGSAGVAG